MSTASNVSAAKPKIGGCLFVAPVGTALPTDAATALAEAFVEAGYVSEDGITNANDMEIEDIRAFGGDTVLTTMSSRSDTFGYTLIETLNPAVLKLVYGSANVSGTLAEGLAVKVNAGELDEWSLVIDLMLRGGALRRIVVPSCRVTELGEVQYSDSAAIGYEVTTTCTPDAAGNTHYEYTLRAAGGNG